MNKQEQIEFSNYPGGDVILQGLRDLQKGYLSPSAYLVLVLRPTFQALGVPIPNAPELKQPAEHLLYASLSREENTPNFGSGDIYGRFSALLKLGHSFARCAERRLLLIRQGS